MESNTSLNESIEAVPVSETFTIEGKLDQIRDDMRVYESIELKKCSRLSKSHSFSTV